MQKEITCKKCNGRGQVPWEFPLWEQCNECKGTGKIIITKAQVDKEIADYRRDIMDIEDEIAELAEIFNENNTR